MTIDEFYQEVKRQMSERGIQEDTQIDYIDTDFMIELSVNIGDNGLVSIL